MYLVRDKTSKKVLHVNPAPLSQVLNGKEVYYQYDPATMEIGKKEGRLPEYFDIDDNGLIVELTLYEKVKLGILKLSDDEAVVNNQIEKIQPESKVIRKDGVEDEIVELSLKEQKEKGLITVNEPFEFINDEKNIIEERELLEIVQKDLVTTKQIADELEQRISSAIAAEIAESYPYVLEIKLVKGYMEWIADGQPEKDKRKQDYLEMQKNIEAIKKQYSPVKKNQEAQKIKIKKRN